MTDDAELYLRCKDLGYDIQEESEYVAVMGDKLQLDGCFTSTELLILADAMARCKRKVGE